MTRYALVACSDCDHLWIVATKHDSATCPRCGRRYDQGRRDFLTEADDKATVVEARSQRLRARAETREGTFTEGSG